MKVCAGIVIYNTPLDVVKKTLVSLANSSMKPDVVIYCNSPSTDYQSKIKILSEKHHFNLVTNAPNNGFGAGHNEIFRIFATNYEWYICCNPDISVDKYAIEHLIVFGERNEDCCLIGPKILNPDMSVQKLSRQYLTLGNWVIRQMFRLVPSLIKPFEESFDYSRTQPAEFVSGAFFAIKSAKFRQLNGFSEDFFLYCEDADLSIRASNIGRNYYVNDAQVVHNWAQAWTGSKNAFKEQLKSLRIYFQKHGYFGVK